MSSKVSESLLYPPTTNSSLFSFAFVLKNAPGFLRSDGAFANSFDCVQCGHDFVAGAATSRSPKACATACWSAIANSLEDAPA
jgi:hypothetical protein